MKRAKRIYILLIVLAVVCAATFAVMQMEEYKEKINNSDEIILEIPAESVTSLSWEYDSESISLHNDEGWIYDDDETFPVDDDKVNELLEQFEEFGVSFVIEDVEDYSQYGLDDPECTIWIETEDESYEIIVGDYSNMDSQRYVSIGDGNAYLVNTDPMDTFEITIDDLIKNDDTPSFDSVTEISFEGEENYTIVYEEESENTYCESDVYFAEIDGESKPLDTTKVNSYINNIRYLNLSDYMTYNADEADLSEYDLDDPEITITIDYTYEDEDGEEVSNTFVMTVSRDPEEIAAAEESKEDEDTTVTAYVRIGESQFVYKVSSGAYEELMAASYDDLRHSEVLTADFDDIYQIDISLEGSVYSITSEGESGDYTYYYEDEELDISDLSDAIESLTASSFTDEKPTEKEEISLTVYLDNENYPKILIELYRYDGSYCLAMVDGEPVSLVKRSSVVDLVEAVNSIVLS